MRPTSDTLCHKLNARTCASLARMYREAGNWKEASLFADKARRAWLKVKWETNQPMR